MSTCTHGTVTNSDRKIGALEQRAVPTAGVDDVGVGRVIAGPILHRQRHLPEPLPRRLGRGADPLAPLPRACEVGADLLAERHRRRTRQRRHVDDVGRALRLGPGHRIGEDETALRVGVRDLDGHPVHRLHHVAGSLGIAAGHVLDHRRDRHERGVWREPGDGPRGRDHRGGARLVVLHVAHALGRLDADAARVEAHALADDRQAVAIPGRVPAGELDGDQARRVRGPLADAEQQAHPELCHLLRLEHLDRAAIGLELARRVRHALG